MADSAADLEAHPHEGGGAAQTAKDLFSGAAGGVAQVLLGTNPYPNPRLNDRRAADVVHSIRVKIAAKAGHELSKAPYLPVTNRSVIAHNPQHID